jgi:hypothetical protein
MARKGRAIVVRAPGEGPQEVTAGTVRAQVLARVWKDARESPKAEVRLRALKIAGGFARTMQDVPGLGRAIMARLLREVDEPGVPAGRKKPARPNLTSAQRAQALSLMANLARTLPETLEPDLGFAGGQSEGQRRLNIVLTGTSARKLALRVGVTHKAVTGWVQDGVSPGVDYRVRLFKSYEIPIGAWDEPARPPPPKAPAEVLAELHLDGGFYEFAQKCGEGYPFTPAQSALAKVCFDGVQPGALEGEELEAALSLFGTATIPEKARRTLALEIGRHGGKTSITAWYVVYRLLTADVSKTFKSTVPKFAILAPRLQTTKQLFDQAVTLLTEIPVVKERIRAQNDEELVFVRPTDGRVMGLQIYPRSPAGRALRGQDFVGLAVDEAQFGEQSRKGEGIISDADQIEAARPRLRGMVIMLSSLWAAPSYMRDVIEHNWRKPTTAIVARGQTLMMRKGGAGYEEVAAEREAMLADPVSADAARREFDLIADDNEVLFYEASLVDAAVEPVMPVATGQNVSAGIDLGFRLDNSALIVTERQGGRVVITAAYFRRPEKNRALDPEVVTREFAELARKHGAAYVCADSHCSDQTERACRAAGLVAVILDRSQLTPAADQTRTLLVQHRLVIPHPGEGRAELLGGATLARELKSIRSKPGPGGTTEFLKPRVPGAGHCDVASALEMAVYDDARRYGPLAAGLGSQGVQVAAVETRFSKQDHITGRGAGDGFMRWR